MATPQSVPESKSAPMEKPQSPTTTAAPSEAAADPSEYMLRATLTASESAPPLAKETPDDSSSEDDDSSMETPAKKSWLPSWITDHLTYKDLRDVLKCSLAAWACFLFVTINPVLQEFGQAAFFGSMVCFFLPPAGIVFIYCLAAATMLIGMCLAWAWGCLTMKIAVLVRDDDLYNSRMQVLQQQAMSQNTTAPSTYISNAVYEGALLDTNVTVVYFCMGLFFIYIMTRLRAAFPKLILMGIFATIVTDVYLTGATINPRWNWRLPLMFIKPSVAAVGVGLFCNIFIFPESCHHLTMYKARGFFEQLKQVMELTRVKPEEEASINALKKRLLAFHTDANQGFAFLPLEPSVGRWSPEDLQSTRTPAQDLLLRFISILNFMISAVETLEKRKGGREMRQHLEEISEVGRYQTLATIGALKFWDWTEQENETAQNTMNTLRENMQPLIDANIEGLDAIADILRIVNCRRWWRRPKEAEILDHVAKHRAVLEKIRTTKEVFDATITDKLLAHHEHLFDADDKLFEPIPGKALPLHGVFLGLNLKARVHAATESLESVLEHVINLEEKRKSTRLWMPTGIRHMMGWATGNTQAPTGGNSDGLEDLERVETKAKQAEEKERMKHRKQVKTRSQKKKARLGTRLVTGLEWFNSTRGALAFRVIILTFALSIPGVLHSSAKFAQREKFLWAMMMAQLGVTEYMADFVLSYTSRFIATVIGGVFGMIIWYCGAGTGVGNPYGIMAMLTPFIMMVMFCRLYAPFVYFQAVVMGAATMLLVVAYSWTHHYNYTYGNPEPGFTVFWHRVVLVVGGLTAALIVQIFPKPPSATKFAAHSLGHALHGITNFYSKVMESWISVDENTPNCKALSKANEAAITDLYSQIGLLEGRVALVKLEPSSSPFTARTLMKIHMEIGKILESIGVVAWTLPTMNPDLRRKIETQTTSLSMHTVADVMSIFTAVGYALKTGQPLPQVLPTPLIRKVHRRKGVEGEWRLHKDVLKTRDFEVYVTGMMAYTSFLSRMDDLVMFTKHAVGESYMIPGARVEEC